MSTPGRIFIVLNLILAALFLGWASNNLATSQDYKTQAETVRQELADLRTAKEEEITSLTAQVTKLEGSSSSLRGERDDAEGERSRLAKELENERERNNALDSDIAAIKSTLGNYDQTNRDNVQRLETASADVQAAIEARHAAEDGREAALEAQRAAEEKLTQAMNRVAMLETDRQSLTAKVDELQTSMQTLSEISGVSLDNVTPMPAIDGAVLQVRTDVQPGLIAINRGSVDGVQRGYTFEIYNGTSYKGQARVETVQANMCTAVIVRSKAPISQGDSASTHI